MAEKVDRLTRVNELIKRELAGLFGRGLFSAPGMLVSVTEVVTSVDLRNATVYVSIMGGKASERESVMHQLEQLRTDFQRELARTLAFKHTPVLCYKLDRRFERGDRVLELINEAEQNGGDK
ncbi:MAG: 30S ribosome-binding factor RbfA [Lentisphaeria bacterium]|nr:30S ribosome-binding factor RbfA [Lentisphaeria bacterium]MBQ7396609.1 30S ribosome-binding factor RbfA [Lentisphaeria bacterium]MBQ7397129.1 30S ribosome-binding factor RbfA [Lentisphaeria bacterium]MBR7120403.1 30S ribosome-binding factor RbfA [Lentisphaeria bacterium]